MSGDMLDDNELEAMGSDPASYAQTRERLVRASARLDQLADALVDIERQVLSDPSLPVLAAAKVMFAGYTMAGDVIATVDRLIGPAVES